MTRLYLSPPDIGPVERAALLDAFDSGWVAPAGPELAAFERDIAQLIGWPGAVAMSSGTAALHLALLTHGVCPGDEVYVSTFTFAATVFAIDYCGATPRFIDSDVSTWNMNPALLAEALAAAAREGRIPKAVVVVDLYGQCADYDEILPICQGYGIPVVEDSAEALGATYHGRPAGTLADCGVFSFNGNKIITTSGGGMFVSPDEVIAARVRSLATQARQPVRHYEHHDIGFNYRLSNLLAALGRAQLSRLSDLARRRREINELYRQLLADERITFMPIPSWSGWNGWLTCVEFSDRGMTGRAQDMLESADIESRPLWKPMHLQPVFADHPAVVDGTSEDLFLRGLCLPSGSALTDSDVERVASIVTRALGPAVTLAV